MIFYGFYFGFGSTVRATSKVNCAVSLFKSAFQNANLHRLTLNAFQQDQFEFSKVVEMTDLQKNYVELLISFADTEITTSFEKQSLIPENLVTIPADVFNDCFKTLVLNRIKDWLTGDFTHCEKVMAKRRMDESPSTPHAVPPKKCRGKYKKKNKKISEESNGV